MKLCYFIVIEDKYTSICGLLLRNKHLCIIFTIQQFLVALASLLQLTLWMDIHLKPRTSTCFGVISYEVLPDTYDHIILKWIENPRYHAYSIRKHNAIFACQSNITVSSTTSEKFLAYDIIIFDYGLMHRVLGTNECIANYLDGGFMRSIWCLSHTSSLFLLLIALFFLTKPIWLLWPALLMQSSYALGLAVLTMATAPKMLDALSGTVDTEFTTAFSIYLIGFICNWLFAFVLWHHYWYVEKKLKTILSKRVPID